MCWQAAQNCVIILTEADVMKEFAALVGKSLRRMNKISKCYIKTGTLVVITAASLALTCQLLLGRVGNYDELLFLRGEFYCLFKNMLAAVYVPGLTVEIIYRSLIFDGYIN